MAKCEFCGKDVKFGIKVSHTEDQTEHGSPTYSVLRLLLTVHQSVYMLAPVVCVQVRLPELTDFTDYETAPLFTVELFFCIFIRILNLNHSTERGLTFVWSALLIISLYQPLKDFFFLTKNEHYTS